MWVCVGVHKHRATGRHMQRSQTEADLPLILQSPVSVHRAAEIPSSLAFSNNFILSSVKVSLN